MQVPELRMSFADRARLSVEITQSLRCGRAFLRETSTLPVLSDCVLVLVHPEHGGELRLPAQIVMANEHGTGLSLTTLNAQHLLELDGFADSPPPIAAEEPLLDGLSVTERVSSELRASARPTATPRESSPPAARHSSAPAAALAEELSSRVGSCDAATMPPPSAADSAPDSDDPELLGDPGEPIDFPRSDEEELEYAEPGQSVAGTELQSESRQERLRNLSPNEQLKVARRGELADRLAVERMYGKQVWEALLQNPRLTIPEVAKIARKGTVPKPLLDVILDNNGWIKADAVRRALLSNPKIGADSVTRLLRITPKHELKLIEKGSTYGAVVREAARRLLKQQS